MALLKLPPEIRQKVYKELLVFVPYNKALPQSAEHRSADPQLRRPQGVQILRVCKTIYYEAVDILYSKNVFTAWKHDEVDLLPNYLRNLYGEIILGVREKHMVWKNHLRGAVSRLFDVHSGTLPNPLSGLLNDSRDAVSSLLDVDSGTLPNPLSGVLNLACGSLSPINLTQVGFFGSPPTFSSVSIAGTVMITRAQNC